jgi:hypothetical protein
MVLCGNPSHRWDNMLHLKCIKLVDFLNSVCGGCLTFIHISISIEEGPYM